MQFQLGIFLFGAMLLSVVMCIAPPHFNYDVVNEAYRMHGGKQDIPKNFLFRREETGHAQKRTEQQLSINQRIKIARMICGTDEKYFYRDIKQFWEQTWLENAKNMTFNLVLYADFDGDEQFTDPILEQYGEFNVSLDCNFERGCVYINPRKTYSTIPGTNITIASENTAVFTFLRSGSVSMLCGFDSQLAGAGINGNGDVIFPIFLNVLNPDGMITGDVFSTAHGKADGGVGSNYYSHGVFPGPNGTATTDLAIYSRFDIINPADPKLRTFLLAQQVTKYSLPVASLPGGL